MDKTNENPIVEPYIDYRIGHIRLTEEEMDEIRAHGGMSEEEYMVRNGYLGKELEAGADGFDDGVINGVIIEKLAKIGTGGDGTIPPIIEEPIPEPEPEPEPKPEPVVFVPKDKPDRERPKIIGIIGIGVATFLTATAIRSCDSRLPNIEFKPIPIEYTRTIEHQTETPFSIEYKDVNGPQDNALGITGESGQEGLTNNVIAREPKTLEGEDYSATEHAKAEGESVEGFEEFQQTREQVKDDISELSTGTLTPSETKDKLDDIEQGMQSMKDQYTAKEDLVSSGVETFTERTLANEDSISQDEIAIIEEMKKVFESEEASLSGGLDAIEDVQEKIESGEKVVIDGVEQDEVNGIYTITGETIETVVEEQRYTGIKAIVEHFKDWIQGKPQHEIDIDQR